ncbi:MAG: hypothetical protein GY870_16165 [archaeon]|nr:hypothetical protein [archaeon]
MTTIVYNKTEYEFSWIGVILFFILFPLISILTIWLFQLFWEYTLPPLLSPIILVLNVFSDSQYYFINDGITEFLYWIYVPDRPSIYYDATCAGIEAYAIFLGISIMTPHNKKNKEKTQASISLNKKFPVPTVWISKIKTYFVASLLTFIANTLRVIIALFFYSLGNPLDPFHLYLGYITSCFSVLIYYFFSYRWIPEFSLFLIWAKEAFSDFITKKLNKSSEKPVERKEIPIYVVTILWGILLTIIIMLVNLIIVPGY